jgi:tetratricopeptide (TPR) repeat protein
MNILGQIFYKLARSIIEPTGQKSAEELALRAGARVARGDDEGAIIDCNASIRIKPNYFAYWHRGMAFLGMERADLALADLTKAIEMNPGVGVLYYLRCVAYGRLGEYEKAIADARIGVRLGIDDPEYLDSAKQWIAGYDAEHH